ncbi:MAG: STAS domain-containing protein [Pseudomonadota bacterium]
MAATERVVDVKTIPLRGALSFATAMAVLDDLTPLIGVGSQNICIDLAGVSEADSAGLALLLELRRRCRAAKLTLRLQSAPPQLLALATFFGLGEILALQ